MKDSFIVQFGVKLWLTRMGIGGILAGPIGMLASWFLGSLLDKGILVIDLTISSLRVALEEKEYRQLAMKAYEHATARVYTEEEKDAIRQEYLAALRNFGTIGVSDRSNS